MSVSLMSLVLSGVLLGQEQAEPSTATDRQEQARFFKAKAGDLALFRKGAKEPHSVTAEPVLRYSNSERDIGSLDGATFLWLDKSRPVAAVSFSIRKVNSDVYRECTSFVAAPLECRSAGAAVWSPKAGGLLEQPLSGAPAPAATKTQRLTQMRSLARRFSAACHDSRTDEPT